LKEHVETMKEGVTSNRILNYGPLG